jgi:hypothetical protein
MSGDIEMITTTLIAVLALALTLFARAEWPAPSRGATIKFALLSLALLCVVGLLAHWGLPVATDILTHA